MEIPPFLSKLQASPESITFEMTMAVIDKHYHFTPTSFQNGEVHNGENQNNGSAKILAFGLEHDLTELQTLACFGDYYRKDVLLHPEGSDHLNIRNFMQFGWGGVVFAQSALSLIEC